MGVQILLIIKISEQMKNLECKKSEQQQLQEILNETFTNTDYCDEDIGQFIHDPTGNYQEMFIKNEKKQKQRRELMVSGVSLKSKASKTSSRKHSEDSHEDRAYAQSFDDQADSIHENTHRNHENAGQFQVFSDEDKNSSIQTSQPEKFSDNTQAQQTPCPEQYKKLQNYYKYRKATHTMTEVKQKYPYFIVSQPTYSINKTYHENTFQYNTIKNINIECIDVGYCTLVENYKIAIGSDDGRVALFEKTYTKPVNLFEAFSNKKNKNKNQEQESKCRVTSIKWSENLQYLAVASSRRQLKVYQFKQSILIEDKNILRTLKQPMEIISLTNKDLKKSVINIKFVSQFPFLLLLNDENDDMQLLEYKKNFMNYRPHLSKLSIKFNDVYQVEVIDFQVDCHRKANKSTKPVNLFTGEKLGTMTSTVVKNMKEAQYGTLLAVSSDQYVTIALLKPYFEVIMVYDKDKHGKNIKKQGYAHISFRKQPLGLLIVWDKYAQLLNIEIESLNPLQSRISNMGSQLMPQTTLLAGLITDTLVYQLSESGIKIYACANFGQEKDATKFKQCIYEHPINFYELPSGMQIQQQLVQKVPTLTVINLLKYYIKTCNGQLFITTNTSLFSVRIQKFEQFIRTTIENINNWKIGLQLLHDAYKGKYRNYDNMTKEVILKNLYEYSVKYVNFLMMVIGNTGDPNNTNQQMLWIQQTTFLFNILIQTEQYQHLFNKILPKLNSSNLSQYIKSLQPFIILHKLQQITPAGLQLLYEHISKQIISILLIANIKLEINEVDLPHTINKILLEHAMFPEMVAVNLQFNDYFTPFVVLVSHYQAIDSAKFNIPSNKNDIQLLPQLKMHNQDSQHSSENANEVIPENPDKQNLREILVYLVYKILRKINTNEDSTAHYTTSQYKKIVNKYRDFLSIFVPLFQTSIIHILLDSPRQEFALFESILPELFSGQCLQIINDISNKQFNTDLMTDIVMGIPIARVKNLRTYWVSLIRLYNRSVIKMEVFMGLRYLVGIERAEADNQAQMKELPMKQKQSVKSLNEKLKKGLSKKRKPSSIEKFIKQTVNMSGFKIAAEFSSLSRELLEEFQNELLSSPSSHIGLLKIVAIILGSGFYIKVILAMMAENNYAPVSNSKPQFVENNPESTLYDFIYQTIQKFSKNEREQLKCIIYENVQIFIQKDCNKLCDLIIEHYLGDIDKFVRYSTPINSVNRNGYTGIVIGEPSSNEFQSSVSVNPYELIHLIEGLLHRLQSPGIQNLRIEKFEPHSEWMLDLRLKFLKLLALTGRQHEILHELQKQNYPLDSSLEICRKYGVIDAEAYLLVKSGGQGEIASAIKLYFTLVAQKIKVLTPQTLPNFKQYFISIIRECIRVCQNLHVALDNFNEEWFLISQELYEMKVNIYRVLVAYTGDLLCDIIDKQVYPILAEKIVRKENSEGIVCYLKLNMGYLDLVFIRALLHEMVKNFAFQKIMFLLTQETYIESQIRERKKICVQTLKGFKTECSCYLCREENGLLIHYSNCGHEIHPSCGQDVKQCFICSYRPEKMIEKQFDLLKRIRPQLYSREVEDEIIEEEEKQKKRKESKMEKLKKFDENKIDILYN